MSDERKKCKFPMSKFYIYEDEVPKNVRVTTVEDCIKCDDMASCGDTKHCLVSDTQIQRKCLNHCPKCNAGEKDIEWGSRDWSSESAWQNATCTKCGCEFSEVYLYGFTECGHNI